MLQSNLLFELLLLLVQLSLSTLSYLSTKHPLLIIFISFSSSLTSSLLSDCSFSSSSSFSSTSSLLRLL